MPSQQELFIGLMSGTSLDGIDAVLVDLGKERPRLIGSFYQPYDHGIAAKLMALQATTANELHEAHLLGNGLAELYASAVCSLLESAQTTPGDIRAIGCHGQTIRHRPDLGYTVQIGNAALLAELTSISVVSDFRSRDVSAGGQGAPLVPAFHDKVLRQANSHRVIVNVGGIANLTNLAPREPTSGFDCGPGNLLMDYWCYQHTGDRYDAEGRWADSGVVLPELLQGMLAHPYFDQTPPKSTGRDTFNPDWLLNRLAGHEDPADVQATLLELTCRSIASSIQRHCGKAQEVFVCGGGARNVALIRRLADLLPESSVRITNDVGVDSDYLEAMAFAWLAQQALSGKPANLPEVTGAKHACILGAIYQR
jgi:anhydro-N-acetylmuramic acid kinase